MLMQLQFKTKNQNNLFDFPATYKPITNKAKQKEITYNTFREISFNYSEFRIDLLTIFEELYHVTYV